MSTHDYIIDNGTGAAVRSDLNNALNAVATTNSVAGTPATTYAYQIFHDTSANQGLKQRDGSNAISNGLLLYRPLVRDGIYDPNNVALATMKFAGVASAVNELTATNAITGNAPILSATGNDTNINLTLSPKGSASVLLGTGTVTNPSFAFTGDTNTGIYRRATDMVGIVEGGIGYPVGYRNTPLSGQEITTAYTLTTADCGKLVTIGTSGSVVVPSDFNAGDIVYLFNNTSGTVNVTKGSITTLYQSGSNTAQTTITMASRTMAAIQFISNTVAVFFSGAASSSSTAFNLDYLIIGGGGGGNNAGGGAGGYINSLTGESYGGGGSRPFSISITPSTTQYIVTVGAGGASNSVGVATTFHTIVAPGGGFGGAVNAAGGNGGAGGSGGGGSATSGGPGGGGNGFANMGYAGGGGGSSSAGGGGGGAGAIGSSGGSGVGGAGGAGLSSSITGTSVTRAGGGGGGGSSAGGLGGAGGGGAGAIGNATAGTANTGGGGGGMWSTGAGAGGSGVVILRYVTADYSGTRTTTGSPSVTTSGIYTILTFNSSGSVTFGV